MTATLQDIQEWLKRAKERKATHLIVAVDRYDHSNYPVYVTSDEDVNKEYNRIIEFSMKGVDKVYNIEKQLSEIRAFNF